MAASNFDNRNALHVACAEGHLVRIQTYSKLGNILIQHFTSPQHCVRYLVETCKLDHKKIDRWGFTPMSEAARFKHESVVAYLNEHIGTINVKF